MRILFVTRKYPPISGGMERYSKELYDALSGVEDADLIANRLGNRALPLFLISAAARIALLGRRYDLIHFGDGLLAVLLPFVRTFTRAAATITVHGLDVTYGNPIYRTLVLPWLRRADRVVCISGNTRKLCLAAGIQEDRIAVIPNGIAAAPSGASAIRRPAGLPEGPEAPRLLFTIGRLVRRKGHEWFIREVMSRLDARFAYVIAGEGPERPRIERAIAESGLGDRIFLLGKVDEAEKEWLYRNSRLFIMPNIPISGDVEGFGLVLVEAATRGLMAVASDLDGIPDATIPGETAVLVPAMDAGAFAAAIEGASPDGARVRTAAESFAWERVVGRYVEEMENAIRRNRA
jgi:phosphatidyl-myo-inositol dimannoside synthase